MKSIIKILLITTLFLVSCQKEYWDYRECYDIPNNRNISTIELLQDSVDIEWSTSDGYSAYSSTKVEQIVDLGRNVYSVEINGVSTPSGNFYPNDTNIYVVVIIRIDTLDNSCSVYALKPMFWDMNFWNASSSAPVGVIENDNEITIYSQNMESSTYEATMCMKMTIYKKD